MIGFSLAWVKGWEDLSSDFCNRPFRVVTDLSNERNSVDMFAAVLLCGRLINHDGPCDHLPPLEDVS